MELKVWVDGIQRVVCGANLSTTCQDVVVALAHAMGRTGRFTLIEKWRDNERPLPPGECPLKSLHKWGEYAAEVRFYLMQAEQQQEKPPQKSQKQRSAQLAETEDSFSHNFTPPLPSSSTSSSSSRHHQLQPQYPHQTSQPAQNVPDSIKRSSTFSGTLNTNYAPVPSSSSSSSLHAKLDSLKQQQQQQQQQYHHHSHPQKQQQLSKQQSLPNPNLSGQRQQLQQRQWQQQSSNNEDKNSYNNNNTNAQPYQNIPLPKNVGSASNQNTPRYPQQQQQKPIPIPTNPHQAKSHRQNNGSLSARSSASSNNSTSPRNLSANSLSPGRGGSKNDISSSPSQDSRYLHPANTPRPSETYSNFPSDTIPSREKAEQTRYTPDPKQQQQQQNAANQSISSTRPVPKPAPRSQHRQLSPSSTPYENLPPRRSVHDSSEVSPRPSNIQMLQPPARRRRDQSRELINKLDNAQLIQKDDPNQWKSRNLVTDNNSTPEGSRGFDGYQKKPNDNRFIGSKELSNIPNNDHNFNSDLSDDCFQVPDPSVKVSTNFQNDPNTSRTMQTKELPGLSKTQNFPTPELSKSLPSYSSSPTRSRSLETGQKVTKSQTLPSKSATPERTRRSEGGRVNFVESALLRQQRLNPDHDVDNKNTDQYSADGRGQRDSSRDRRQIGELHSNSIHRGRENSQEPSYTSFSGYNGGDSNQYYESKGNDFTDSVSTPFNHSPSASSSDFYHPHQQHNYQNHQQKQQQYHHSPQQSPRTSAFKVVSPRSSHPTSLSSSHSPISPTSKDPPPLPVAYNLDNQNFDLPVNLGHHPHPLHHQHHPLHPSTSSSFPEFSTAPSSSSPDQRPHSRQASLEIEEYDLDQNFPDVSQKDLHHHHHHPNPHQSSTLPRVSSRKGAEGMNSVKQGQGYTTEYVMDRPSGGLSSMEPEYMRVLRQVKMQQEQLKMLDSRAHEMDTEISNLETDQSNLDLKLDVVSTELESLEKMEEKILVELQELDRVEWVNVLDGETKCEHDLRGKMSKLRVELNSVETKLEELSEEEKSKENALKQEQQSLEEKEKKEELQALQQLTETKKDLSDLDTLLRQKEDEMKTLENGIKEMENKIISQEEEAERLEKLLHCENLKEFHSNPVPKEPPPTSLATTAKITTDIDNNLIITNAPVVDHLTTPSSRPTTPRSRPPSETGEAIIKILEGRLSPRAPPSPFMNDDVSNGSDDGVTGGGSNSTTTLQNSLKSTTTLVKNPNGVWV